MNTLQDRQVQTIANSALPDRDRIALADAAQVVRRHFPGAQVLLFGSKARGTGGDDSDLDILVITATPAAWRERHALVEDLLEVELAHDVVLSPLVVNAAEWSGGIYKSHPIRAEVERDGIIV